MAHRRPRGHPRLLLPPAAHFPGIVLKPAAKRFKRVDSATTLIWKLLTVAEKRARKLNAPHLLRQVAEGKIFKDGKPVPTAHGWAAA